jgi:uncharacterized membrane protein YeaQ/YmgE (transglycosylase-associated protein family)
MLAEISFFSVLWYVIAGLVIGLLARLFLPGKQQMNILWTIVLGVAGAVIGGFLWEAIFSNRGIAWIGSVIAAVVILWGYERFVVARGSGPPSSPDPGT